MSAMNVFNSILAIAVIGGLATVCRTAYMVARHRHEEHVRLEIETVQELERAA